MIAYILQLKIIVMPLITMIIMISGALPCGPGPGLMPARNKAGKKWFSTERDSGYCGVGVEVANTAECVEGSSQEDLGLLESSGPTPLLFWPQTQGNFGKRVKLY